MVTEFGGGEEMEADAGVEDEREDVERPVPLVDLADFRELCPAVVGLHLGDEPEEVILADGVAHPVVADDRPHPVPREDSHEVGRLEVTVLVVVLKETFIDDGLEDVLVSLVQTSDPGLDVFEERVQCPSEGGGGAHRSAEGHDGGAKPAGDGFLAEFVRPEGAFVGREVFPERLEDFSAFFPALRIREGLKGRRGEECELFVDGRHIFRVSEILGWYFIDNRQRSEGFNQVLIQILLRWDM